MMQFATMDDFINSWTGIDLSGSEALVAATLLGEANARAELACDSAGADPQEMGDAQLSVIRGTVCGAVKRAMKPDMYPSSEYGQMDAFESTAVGGRVYFTDRELSMMGLGRTRAGFAGMR